MPLDAIRAVVYDDLAATDHFICNALQSKIPLIHQLLDYVLRGGGKRIRPLLVLLSARAFYDAQEAQVDLAAAIELIHTATLLHDDVVDNANLRRGRKTANIIWGNEASVLVGDFLYSRAFQCIVRLNHLPILNIFAEATNLIAEGEVLQLMHARNPDTTEQEYYAVIERKTAKLFAVATQTGAALFTQEPKYLQAMHAFGHHLGLAYQLIDDALDYRDTTGKNMGNDLIEGKATLPFIYALRKASPEKVEILRNGIMQGKIENPLAIMEIVESTGAIKYTANAARHHATEALQKLQDIPESKYREALQALGQFVIERTY